ncbi:dynamin family protein [Thiocapsa roseopersicina]|uniref:Dynamin family protein n=1 Tax=Thiocapsa roseopersicina TaxID=1058 RepID=A0A1H3BL00_THIRO|nr:dynamin family protein [Thiocapsa roseopersicina]SDX41779.1 Dynamin family protein [Thiocapsa roseopersicina]
MGTHWVERLFKTRADEEYGDLPFSDNVQVRRLADAERLLKSLRFADPGVETERQTLLDEICRTFRRISEIQVTVVVAGDWNAGKSTLINAFLGEHWLPVNVTRETVTINRIVGGPYRRIRVLFLDGRAPWQLPHDYPNADFVHSKIKELGEQHRDVIERIDVFYPDHSFLKWVALIDTPGLDFSTIDDRVSQPLIDDADVLLWVMHLEGPRQLDLTALRAFRRGNPGNRVLAVVNYADLLDDDERAEVLADKKEKIGDDADAVFLVSAKNDLKTRDSDPGFRELRTYLNEHILPSYGEVRHRRPSLLARERIEQVAAFIDQFGDRTLKSHIPYRLGGEDCWTAYDLAYAVAGGWEDALAGLGDGRITAWLRTDIGEEILADAVDRLMENGALTPDERVIYLQTILAPGKPLTWRGIEINRSDLFDLARRARHDKSAMNIIREIYRNRVLLMCSEAGNSDYAAIQRGWECAVTLCEKIQRRKRHCIPRWVTDNSNLDRIVARLLLFQLDVELLEEMRTTLGQGDYPKLQSTVRWYRCLGDPENGPPEIAALLMELAPLARRDACWCKTQELRTVAAYEDFLRRYPKGPFSKSIREELSALLRKELLQDRDNPGLRCRYLAVRTREQRIQDAGMYTVFGFTWNDELTRLSSKYGPLPPGDLTEENASERLLGACCDGARVPEPEITGPVQSPFSDVATQ